MKESIILSTKHNYAALINLCRGIESKGYWRQTESIDSNVATAVAHLFESIAWSDRSLHRAECRVLDALMHEDEAMGGKLALIFSLLPKGGDGDQDLPDFIHAAMQMDSENGTYVAPILVNQLDILAQLIAHADERVDQREVHRMKAYRAAIQRDLPL